MLPRKTHKFDGGLVGVYTKSSSLKLKGGEYERARTGR